MVRNPPLHVTAISDCPYGNAARFFALSSHHALAVAADEIHMLGVNHREYLQPKNGALNSSALVVFSRAR